MIDVAVIGSGVGGLVAAGLLARGGRGVVLFESHDKPGGTAGTYEAGGFTFDAGATTLIGLEPRDPLAAILEALRVSVAAEPMAGVAIDLPGGGLFCGRDEAAWREQIERSFPGARTFFDRVRRDGDALWRVSRSWPRLPLRSLGDVGANVRLLDPALVRLAATLGRTVTDVERQTGAPSDDPAFRAFVDASLLITVQTDATSAPWWNGALGLDLFRRGVFRARGGMKSFVGALLRGATEAGVEPRFRTLVTGLRRRDGRWVVKTAAGEEIEARAVVANLPRERVPKLLGREEAPPDDAWGAATWNLGLSTVVHPEARQLHRLVVPRWGGRALFLSFSPPGDAVAPEGGQTLSVSTHVEAAPWLERKGAAYAVAKADLRNELCAAVRTLYPALPTAVVHEDLGTPRSFRRFARRARVGGLRTTLANTGFNAPDATFGLPAFQLVGDTTFPGQGTLAVAISGALAAERLGAVRLHRDGGITPGGLSGR